MNYASLRVTECNPPPINHLYEQLYLKKETDQIEIRLITDLTRNGSTPSGQESDGLEPVSSRFGGIIEVSNSIFWFNIKN